MFAAELQLAGSGHVLPGGDLVQGLLCIAVAIAAGAVIGVFQGSFVAFLGVPSFVVTLAGLLAWQGVLFKALPQSVITIQNSTINDVAGYYFSHEAGWIIAAIASAVYAIMALGGVIGRLRAGIRTRNLALVLLKVVGVDNVMFASEMVGAVNTIDPKTGRWFDDTKPYLDGITWLTDADRQKLFEDNAKRVYSGLNKHLAKA